MEDDRWVGGVRLDASRGGGRPLGGEGCGWTLAEVEDDRWAERREFECQQGWKRTAGRRGVNLTARRGGRGLLARIGVEKSFMS